MDQLTKLRKKAGELLQNNDSNINERRKFEIIKNILKDDDCFLAMDIEHAYAILRDLGVSKELIDSYYSTLIMR